MIILQQLWETQSFCIGRPALYGFCPLASGSKGNSLYLGTSSVRILIDAGLTLKGLKARLDAISVDLSTIDAIFITHEHVDHMRALDSLATRLDIPIFANAETAKVLCKQVKYRPSFRIFSTNEPFSFGDLQVYPFNVQHDTVDPVMFTIQTPKHKIGICTDLGFPTSSVQQHLQNCDLLYLESNHEPSMVHASSRPHTYKKRVLSRQGHLSNEQCGSLLKALQHPRLQQVYLAHLSAECNHPDSAIKHATAHLPECVSLTIALQDSVSRAFAF